MPLLLLLGLLGNEVFGVDVLADEILQVVREGSVFLHGGHYCQCFDFRMNTESR
jgi:hypothetical protein